MPLRKIGRYYYIDLYLRDIDKRIRRSLFTTNQTEAIELYKEEKEKIYQEFYKKKTKFNDFCDQYIKWAKTTKPASAPREEQRLEKIREFFSSQGIEYLSQITTLHVEQLRAHLKKQDLSNATVNRYLQILRGMFYRAIDWELYEKINPVKRIKFYKERPAIKIPSNRDLDKILKAARDISKKPLSPVQKVIYDLILLSLNTGMRKTEILNLKWADIQINICIIKGKGEKTRRVPLNKTALQIIRRQPVNDDFVFDIPNRDQHDLLRRTINKIQDKSKVDFHFHLCRHIFMTRLLEKGVDLVTAADILGHSKVTTSLIYGHTSTEKMENAVKLLD